MRCMVREFMTNYEILIYLEIIDLVKHVAVCISFCFVFSYAFKYFKHLD